MKAVLGKSTAGDVSIDVERLVASRMLLSANSGGGKSWAIRRLLEQTHGAIQQLVIDPEGEFFTLREKFDYVLAGKGGDCPAEPRSAALLARRLLELGTSAILDLYELTPADRVLFVRRFVEALVDAPRELWHPALVVIDEAHTFAPESGHGQAQSVEAVARLMSQGRKRGFAGVLATQRLAKLAKDVAAEANNVVIGRFTLDIDVARAGAALGMSKADATTTLRALKPGHFFAYGPAISDDVVEFHFGEVKTSHPKAGQRATQPPPPREKVKKILGQLADLPKEAEEEARTLADAKAQITTLRRELTIAKKAAPEAKVERVEVPILTDKDRKALDDSCLRLEAIADWFADANKILGEAAAGIRTALSPVRAVAAKPVRSWPDQFIVRKMPAKTARAIERDIREHPGRITNATRARVEPDGSFELGNTGMRRMLVALAQNPDGLTGKKLSILTRISRKGGTWRTYMGKLRGNGLVEGSDASITITDAGLAVLGSYEPLPTGAALADHWRAELGDTGMRRLFDTLVEAWPSEMSKEDLASAAGIEIAGGTWRTYMGKLRSLELIEGKDRLRASDELFDGVPS